MEQKIRKIVVPVDASEGASRAARLAGELAEALGAKLVLLNVVDRNSVTLLGIEALSNEEFGDAADHFSSRAFEAAVQQIGDGLEPEKEFRLGNPAEEIIRFAENQDCDLIVMGSRGLSRFKELMVGSVSSQVLHHAPCSVTVVR